ncbi:hypothetical protein [Geodermatophilus sp. SYSU D01176]
MGLAPGFVPIVYAEIYRGLRARCQRQLEDRLDALGRDLDWLQVTIDRYQRMWDLRIEQAFPTDALFEPAGDEHTFLAAWIAAGLRGAGPCIELETEILERIRPKVGAHGAPHRLVDRVSRPALVAWALGQVVGDYDRTLPVAFSVEPSNPNVRLAYDGLVQHVMDLPSGDGEWPEMLGSSILWRACGLADGLHPQPGALNLLTSVGHLIRDMRSVVPPTTLERWRREWQEFKGIRDGFTHVTAGERGQYGFAEVATRMRSQDDVRTALSSATHFVGHQIALDLSDEDPRAVEGALRTVEYELDAYEDIAIDF